MLLKSLLALTVITIGGFSVFQLRQQELREKELLFEDFMVEHGRSYTGLEKAFRLSIFLQNLEIIKTENSNPENTYTLGITAFADMTALQFREKVLMPDLHGRSYVDEVFEYKKDGALKLDPVDWSKTSAVTAVKNQGQCGSCWAFSTTGVIESAWFLAKGNLVSLSEQQLVDCCGAKGFGCQGCNGAWPEDAVKYVASNGAFLENQYPYTARNEQCKDSNPTLRPVSSTNPFKMVPTGNVQQLINTLQDSPVSVCVDASKWSLYRGGVFNNCKTQPLDHAVLLVGVDATGVWKIKNSWGTGWGENGFIRLSAGNTCGVAEHALTVKTA